MNNLRNVNMTLQRLNEIEQEVCRLVDNLINAVGMKSFSDYVLLIIHADYDSFHGRHKTSLNLSPYVIEDARDDCMDMTRQRLIVPYLNGYRARLLEGIYEDDDAKEIEMNMQLMMYSHVWESHLFLKELERIALILAGEGYKWDSSVSNTSKANFIKQHIIQKFEITNAPIADFIKSCYNNNLRNDFAHSTYHIDFNRKVIQSYKDGFMGSVVTSFIDWEEKFIKSVLLSYYLSKCIRGHKDSFIESYGNSPVLVKRPLMADSQKNQFFYVKPEYINHQSGRIVRFNFVTKKSPLSNDGED